MPEFEVSVYRTFSQEVVITAEDEDEAELIIKNTADSVLDPDSWTDIGQDDDFHITLLHLMRTPIPPPPLEEDL